MAIPKKKSKKNSMFNRGYEGAREEIKKQKARQENMGKRLFNLFLTEDDDEAEIIFLTHEPINFYEHNDKVVRNGKEFYESTLCTNDGNCPKCEEGSRPSYKGAFLVWDTRPFEAKNDKGKTVTVEGSVKLYKAGARVLSQLDRLATKYGLENRTFLLSRTGSGQNTQYMFERGDEIDELSEDEIRDMLPDKLKDEYDGTEESLYAIVEEQLTMTLDSGDTETKSKKSSHKHTDDDDDEEDYDDSTVSVEDVDEEDEDVDEAPKKKSSLKSKSKKSSVKLSFKKNR